MLYYYYLRRPFMGFVFVSNTGRAGWPSRAAFYLEPGRPNQGRPGECLEKSIIFSSRSRNQMSNQPQAQHGTFDDTKQTQTEYDGDVASSTVHCRSVLGRWPRQAWRGGWKSREDGPSEKGGGNGGHGCARQARRASVTGVWPKRQARREHDPTEGQDGVGSSGRQERRRGLQLWLASEKSLTARTVPRRQARRDHSDEGFTAFFFLILFQVESISLRFVFPTFRRVNFP